MPYVRRNVRRPVIRRPRAAYRRVRVPRPSRARTRIRRPSIRRRRR